MKQLALLVFIFFSSVSFSQTKFVKATVYKADGSVMECFIINSAIESTQQQFEYASESGGKTNTIGLGQLKSIVFEDGIVLEKHYLDLVAMNINPIERRIEDYGYPERKVTGWFMVEKVIEGANSLYQFIDKYQYPHFYYKTKSDSSIQKLEYQVYQSPDTSGKLSRDYQSGIDLVYKRSYRNQILFLASASGCEKKLEADVNKLDYKISGMISVFKKLNACSGADYKINNKYLVQKPRVVFTAIVGAAATSLTFPDPDQNKYPGLTAESFSGKIGPLVGASMEIVPSKRQKNYIVSLDLLFHTYSAVTDSLHPTSYLVGIGNVKFSAFSVSPSVRFLLTKSVTAPFLEFGVSYRALSSSDNYYYWRNTISGVSKKEPIFEGKQSSLALFGGAGVQFKRFSIHGRYSFPTVRNSVYYSTIFLMGKIALSKKGY